MSANNPSATPRPLLKNSAPMCTCELVADENGHWKLVPEATPECVNTVETMAKNLGPSSKAYLANHFTPETPELKQAVEKLKGTADKPAKAMVYNGLCKRCEKLT